MEVTVTPVSGTMTIGAEAVSIAQLYVIAPVSASIMLTASVPLLQLFEYVRPSGKRTIGRVSPLACHRGVRGNTYRRIT